MAWYDSREELHCREKMHTLDNTEEYGQNLVEEEDLKKSGDGYEKGEGKGAGKEEKDDWEGVRPGKPPFGRTCRVRPDSLPSRCAVCSDLKSA